MDDIIEALLALPDLELPPAELHAIGRIINFLEELTLENVLLAVQIKIEKTKPYFEKLFYLINLINEFYALIKTTWHNAMGEPISADFLLPIVIELIPSEADLEKIKSKLETITELQLKSELGYNLSNLGGAVLGKIDKIGCSDDPEEANIHSTVAEVKKYYQNKKEKQIKDKITLALERFKSLKIAANDLLNCANENEKSELTFIIALCDDLTNTLSDNQTDINSILTTFEMKVREALDFFNESKQISYNSTFAQAMKFIPDAWRPKLHLHAPFKLEFAQTLSLFAPKDKGLVTLSSEPAVAAPPPAHGVST